MASKVPKFGAWEGGENYTVYFDNARKMKNNGQMINPNDPEENPDMSQAPPTQSRPDSQEQQSKVPQFGAWDNGDNVGYTVYFENARKTKNGGPTVTENEPKMNRDVHPRSNPSAQARPATAKPEPQQEARSKVPQFGAWVEGGGEVAYTACFDNVRKNNMKGPTGKTEPSNAPQLNRDVSEAPPKEGRSKGPQFGDWDGGEDVAYTAYFDNALKNKNVGSGAIVIEPQLNRDVIDRAQPPTASTRSRSDQKGAYREEGQLRNASRGSASSVTGSENPLRQGKQTPGGQSPLHPKGGKLQYRPPAGRGSQAPEKAATIPPFGVWNTDPSQAEGFTGTFTRAKEEKRTPLNQNTPASYHQQTHHPSKEQKKCCCFSWF